MYRRGHLRNSDSKRQVRYGTPLFRTTAAERIAAWEQKQAAEQMGRTYYGNTPQHAIDEMETVAHALAEMQCPSVGGCGLSASFEGGMGIGE